VSGLEEFDSSLFFFLGDLISLALQRVFLSTASKAGRIFLRHPCPSAAGGFFDFNQGCLSF
jgi:hypothetical protein